MHRLWWRWNLFPCGDLSVRFAVFFFFSLPWDWEFHRSHSNPVNVTAVDSRWLGLWASLFTLIGSMPLSPENSLPVCLTPIKHTAVRTSLDVKTYNHIFVSIKYQTSTQHFMEAPFQHHDLRSHHYDHFLRSYLIMTWYHLITHESHNYDLVFCNWFTDFLSRSGLVSF